MKRYKLKKELPKYKIGDEFRITEKGHLAYGNTMVFHRNDLKRFPKILRDWFEEIPQKPKTVDDLKEGDECWTVFCSEFGYVAGKVKFNKAAIILRRTGSLYLTKEEAEQDIAWNMAKATLERDTKGFKLKKKASYVSVFWNGEVEGLRFIVYKCGHISSGIKFATVEDAEASIKAHPKEWKMYLGVEE